MCAGQGKTADGVNVLKHPEKHTVNCLRMYTCVKSGYLSKAMTEALLILNLTIKVVT